MRRLAMSLAAVLLSAVSMAHAQTYVRMLDLSGSWKFEAGDDPQWASAGFNDRSWESIRVPGTWEDQGYPGYDGFAWYRKHFAAPMGLAGKVLTLKVGTIDDADEVYVNGRFIGFTGQMPPHYETAYSLSREYQIPSWLLHEGGDNVIAVRVFDDHGVGGITGGEVGLYEEKNVLFADVSMEGEWKFRTGDEPEWKEPDFNDATWKTAYVPAYWETQGYKYYDGKAWYRYRFRVPPNLANSRLMLLLGKIDDCDETYLNGQRIGRTGWIPEDDRRMNTGNEFRQLRTYTIPAGLLNRDSENVIAVRVYDSKLHGGIYRGPIGLVTREHYNQWRSRYHNNSEFWRGLEDFFNR